MKALIAYILMFLPFIMIAQIQPDSELVTKLSSKQKFSEIKQTVLNHYNAKLNLLSATDTLAKKQYMRQLKMWNRQFWISEYYTNENGIVQNANDINASGLEAMNRMLPKNAKRHQPNNWVQQGPFWSDNGIGRFDKIAFHPTNPNTIYAGSPHGGLFKTIDGGNNWISISAFLPSLGISGIVIHPTNPNIIYVLTGDGNTGIGCFPGNFCLNLGEYISTSKGVYKSIDGGNSWQETTQLSNIPFRGFDLIIHPTNPEILLAATTIGLCITTNGGTSWNVAQQSNAGIITDVEFKPGDPTIVYGASSDRFFRSINTGANFNLIQDLTGANRISIGVSPDNNSKVYLIASNNTGSSILASADSGLNFNITSNQHIIEGQSLYNHTIAINPTDANDIYVGGLNVWHSSNGGISWAQVSRYWPNETPYMHPDIHHLAFSHLNNKLYCANDGGIYLFENSAWTSKFNGLSTSQFYHFERENDNGKIWGGLQDNGIEVQVNSGNYTLKYTGDGYDQITDHPYNTQNGNGENVYFTINESIYREVNGVLNIIPVPGNTNFFGNLALDPFNESIIYVGYNEATYKSINKGANWLSLTNGTNTEFPGNWSISASGSSIIAAGSSNVNYDNGIRKYNSVNGIEDFTPQLILAGYNNSLKITDIDINQNDLNNIYISVAGTEPNIKVFCSNNAGMSWSNITYNLPNIPIFSIKQDLGGGIYVGTSIGVFYKPTNYTHWQPFSNALPPVPVSEIELDNANNSIIISTFGRGIWSTQKYAPICENNLPLSGVLKGVHYKESNNTITSTQELQGGEGTDVKYNSGNRITLTDGFRAWYGSKFKTYLTGCGGVVD